MRIVVANCSVIYQGRGDTFLPPAIRAIIIKADGAVSIHADTNGNKPLNYMGSPNTFTETKRGRQTQWLFSKKNETIQVKLHKILEDVSFDMSPSEPGLDRSGTEKHLHYYIAENPECIGLPNNTIMHHEFDTGAGAVDLLAELTPDSWVAIEVKRVAALPSVDQIQRYVDALTLKYPGKTIDGMLVALEFKDSTLQQAALKNIQVSLIKTNS